MSLYERKHNLPYLENHRMGVVIENNSNENKSVWFLGTKKNNYKHMDNVLLSNMFSDTFLDDNSLTMLKNWLISKGEIIIAVTRIRADNELNYSLEDKLIIDNGENNSSVMYITRYFNPYQHSHSILDIAEQILVTAFTSFNVTLKPNAKVGIMFFPSNNVNNAKAFDGKDFNDMYDKIKEETKDITETNKKRYLLLCR